MPYCGAWIWGLCFLVVAGIVSIIPGIAAFVLARRKKSPAREFVAALTMIGAFLLMTFGCCGYYGYCSGNFYCDGGFGDYWRIPLKYPYQISSYDGLYEGCLDIWHGDRSCILSGITHYTANDLVMVGRAKPPCPGCPEKWFWFNFETQEHGYYYNEQTFNIAYKRLGFVREPVLRSIREHFYED